MNPMMNPVRRHAGWVPVALWMLLIFLLSAQPATVSGQSSERVLKVVLKLTRVDEVDPVRLGMWNDIARDIAHVLAYLVLGVLTRWAMKPGSPGKNVPAAVSLLVCVLYSVTDEVHQYFVPGRSMQAKDLLLDGAGALMGIVLYEVLGRIRGRHHSNGTDTSRRNGHRGGS